MPSARLPRSLQYSCRLSNLVHIHPERLLSIVYRTYSTGNNESGDKLNDWKRSKYGPNQERFSDQRPYQQHSRRLETIHANYNKSRRGQKPFKKTTADLTQAPVESAEEEFTEVKADHRSLGTFLSLFTTHPSSPGSPLFLPDGTHIFEKLKAFLRAHYPQYGIQEVTTPTIFKENLWVRSGHWANYKDEMFTVTGRSTQGLENSNMQIGEDEQYGLKPMNCPGHCLLFQSQKRSYRDLPIRYAEFSPLHRNEMSGSLSGLTRVRRFHQDDGHIFCRPGQVKEEIKATLKFVQTVYKTFDLGCYKLVLSTRPSNSIGNEEDWERAEAQLEAALIERGDDFEIDKGQGAFYGPKIDIILTDNNGKTHQTATIQLDFQLPKRFELEYQSPAPEQEAKGMTTEDPGLMATIGTVTPVIIHRAILGSLERFLALLIERYQGNWPFWLSPRQMIILTVGKSEKIDTQAVAIQKQLAGNFGILSGPRPLDSATFTVHIDLSDRSLAKKLVEARKMRYNMVGIFGAKNLIMKTLDMSLYGRSNSERVWNIIEKIKPGSAAPVQKGVAAHMYRHIPGVQLSSQQCMTLMERLSHRYL